MTKVRNQKILERFSTLTMISEIDKAFEIFFYM